MKYGNNIFLSGAKITFEFLFYSQIVTLKLKRESLVLPGSKDKKTYITATIKDADKTPVFWLIIHKQKEFKELLKKLKSTKTYPKYLKRYKKVLKKKVPKIPLGEYELFLKMHHTDSSHLIRLIRDSIPPFFWGNI